MEEEWPKVKLILRNLPCYFSKHVLRLYRIAYLTFHARSTIAFYFLRLIFVGIKFKFKKIIKSYIDRLSRIFGDRGTRSFRDFRIAPVRKSAVLSAKDISFLDDIYI